MANIIAVVGCQRSGTTLTAQIIGAHPCAIMIDENDGLYKWTDALFSSMEDSDVNSLLHKCFLSAKSKYQRPHERFNEHGQTRTNIQSLILKAPNLTYSSAEISKTFPSAKIIYLFRDIRAIVSSVMAYTKVPILHNQIRHIQSSDHLSKIFSTELTLLQQNDDVVKPYIKMALVAKIKMSLSDQFTKNGLDVIKVKYEELVAQPQHMIPYLVKKLGLPFSLDCLHHHEVLRGVGPGGTHRSRPVDLASSEKWKDKLSQQESDQIWNMVGDFMEDLGYNQS